MDSVPLTPREIEYVYEIVGTMAFRMGFEVGAVAAVLFMGARWLGAEVATMARAGLLWGLRRVRGVRGA